MKVCKCDRCGAVFEPHYRDRDFYSRTLQISEETFSLTDTVGEVLESYDICDNCYKDFKRWFKRGALKGVSK